MSQKSPLALVKETFGGKDKLVDKLVTLLGSQTDESKDDLKKRLLSASNAKLLRLHGTATAVKESYGGSREKLIAAAAGKQAKDKDFVAKLEGLTTGALLDRARAAEKRAKRAAAAKSA